MKDKNVQDDHMLVKGNQDWSLILIDYGVNKLKGSE